MTSVAYDITLRGGTRIDVIFYAGGTSILGINQQTMIFPTFGTEIKINKMLARLLGLVVLRKVLKPQTNKYKQSVAMAVVAVPSLP